MNWLWLALLTPILIGGTNFIDKTLVTKYPVANNYQAISIFAALFSVFLIPITMIVGWSDIPAVKNGDILVLMLSGLTFGFYLIPYLMALDLEDTSVVVPIFQMRPIFSAVLGIIFLGEVLSTAQISGIMAVIVGGAMITLDTGAIAHKKLRLNFQVIKLALSAAFLLSINLVLFKVGGGDYPIFAGLFYHYLGLLLAGLVLLGFSDYRKAFFQLLRKSGTEILALNFANETITTVAVAISFYCSQHLAIADVSIISGLEPAAVLIIGTVLTLFKHRVLSEDITPLVLVKKIASICIIFAGGYLAGFGPDI